MKSFFAPQNTSINGEKEPPVDEPLVEHGQFEPWREMAGLAWLWIEIIWVSAWYSGLSQLSHPASFGRCLAVLGVLFAGAHYLARAFEIWQVRENVKRWAFGIYLALVIWLGLDFLYYAPEFRSPLAILAGLVEKFAGYGSIPFELLLILIVLLVVWRGVNLAGRNPTVNSLLNSFQLGLLMMILYGAFLPEGELQTILIAFVIFLFFSLAGLSVARLQELGSMRGGKQVAFSYRWLGGIGISALAVIGLGLIPAWLLRTRVGELLYQAVVVIIGFVAVVVTTLLLPFAKVFMDLLAGLVVNMQGPLVGTQVKDLQNSIQKWIDSQLVRAFTDLARLAHLARPLILWGIILAVVLGIFLALRWQAQRRRRSKADQSKDLLNMGDLLKNMGDALLKRAQEAAEALASRFRLGQAARLLQAARIRWVYFQMMDLCTELGHPRPAAVTPLEFLPDLEALFPDSQPGLAFLTQAYLKVRYGELPESRDEVEQVISAWKIIETQGRRQKTALKKAR